MRRFCSNCGIESDYSTALPITPKLQADWKLNSELTSLFNIREGKRCKNCGVNKRAQDLAVAILESKFGYGAKSLVDWVAKVNKTEIKVCELNSCHELHKTLVRLKNLTYAEYGTDSQEDIENLSYDDNSFDLVLHSEVLEHVDNPAKAMNECRRVLKKDGLILFTTPVLWSRKTVKRAKETKLGTEYLLPKSYHGQETEDYLVRYEFGSDIDSLLGVKIALNNWEEHNYVFSSGKRPAKLTAAQKKTLLIQENKSVEDYKNAILENDYERMVPEFHIDTLTYAEHITRYSASRDIVTEKIILDIASGSGYGTKMLSETAKFVYGVDVNEKAIEYSKKHYAGSNIKYLLGNGEKIPLENDTVDVVTTFETIEHIENYKKFITEIKRVLRKDGVAVVSTPNDLEFAEGNHFHLHEFTDSELMTLLKEHFKYVKPYYQATWKYVALADEKTLSNYGDIKIPTKNLAPVPKKKYLYFYFVCSNRKITEIVKPAAALGEHYSDRYMANLKNGIAKDKQTIKRLEETLNHRTRELVAIRSSRTYLLAKKIAKVKGSLRTKRKG